MGSFILKFDTKDGPRYLEYSTICDAPITYGMTLLQFKKHYQHEYGVQGMANLNDRLARADVTGSSSRIHDNLEQTIKCNRAGKGETHLTLEQFVDYYITRKGRGEQPTGKRQ